MVKVKVKFKIEDTDLVHRYYQLTMRYTHPELGKGLIVELSEMRESKMNFVKRMLEFIKNTDVIKDRIIKDINLEANIQENNKILNSMIKELEDFTLEFDI